LADIFVAVLMLSQSLIFFDKNFQNNLKIFVNNIIDKIFIILSD